MRKYITETIKTDEYLLHADMLDSDRFPCNGNVINCGLGENNLLNVAGGIASQGNTVFIYGVAGFIIHRFEQLKLSCKLFGANIGKIIIFNAGKIGYSDFGIGHSIEDDYNICKMLNIPFYAPEDLEALKATLKIIENKNNGIFYIQLGKDY